jgi:hypothetical protein
VNPVTGYLDGSMRLRRAIVVLALAAAAWLGLGSLASRARACSCAERGPVTPVVLPATGSFVPRNTRIWLLTQTAQQPQHELSLELRGADGVVIETRTTKVILGNGGAGTLVMLEPSADLPANAAFTAEVIGVLDGKPRQRSSFHTNETIDVESPEPPSAEDVMYSPPDSGSSCGGDSSLSVALSADAWIVKRSSEASPEDGPRLHRDVSGSSIEAMFLDEPGGYELVSGVCPGHRPAAKGSMQLGTFDLAGNFSGWGERVRFEPADTRACSVSAGAVGRRVGRPSWMLAVVIGLVALRAIRRARALRRSAWRGHVAHWARLALLLATLGCAGGQTGSEQRVPVRQPPPECSVDADCAAHAARAIAVVSATRGPARLLDARCSVGPDCRTPACHCMIARGDESSAETVVLDPNGCALHGRGLACLWPDGALPCESVACSCVDQCARAARLLSDDAARTVQAQTRTAKCSAGVCRTIMEIDGVCYVGAHAHPHPGVRGFECGLSDRALFSAAEPETEGDGTYKMFCGVGGATALPVADAGLDRCMNGQAGGGT